MKANTREGLFALLHRLLVRLFGRSNAANTASEL